MTNKSENAGKLPGWTLLVGLLDCVVALMLLEACRDFGLSWWIGVPAAIIVILVGALAARVIERKYLPTSGRK